MKTICEVDTKMRKVTRGRHKGKEVQEAFFVTVSKYSWDLATKVGDAQIIGQKYYSGFKVLFPSAYEYYKVDPQKLVRSVVESLPDFLEKVAVGDKRSELEENITNLFKALKSSNNIKETLREIGKNVDELYHCNCANALHEDESGNVYKRIKI